MVELKTAKERLEEKKKRKLERDKKIYSRFMELKNMYNTTDAVCITANEFNLTVPTIYSIRKRIEKEPN